MGARTQQICLPTNGKMIKDRGHQFSKSAKIFRNAIIFYPLIRTRKSTCRGVRNFSFLERFAHILNG